MPEGASDAPLRDRILEDVRGHPGASARDIQRRVGTAWGETAYHLERLTRSEELRRERGGWRDYYFSRELTWADRRIFQALQSPAERALVLTVLRYPGSSFTDLVGRTGLGRSTASFHLRRLLELGVLGLPSSGTDRGYLVVDEERTRLLLTEFAESFAGGLVDRFVDAFGGLLKE